MLLRHRVKNWTRRVWSTLNALLYMQKEAVALSCRFIAVETFTKKEGKKLKRHRLGGNTNFSIPSKLINQCFERLNWSAKVSNICACMLDNFYVRRVIRMRRNCFNQDGHLYCENLPSVSYRSASRWMEDILSVKISPVLVLTLAPHKWPLFMNERIKII